MGVRRTVRGALESLLTPAGYTIVPKWKLEFLEGKVRRLDLPQHLARLLERTECDCVMDVGANRGQFADMLRAEANFKGQIVSYEPVPELAAELVARWASDPLRSVQPCALGHQTEERIFNIMASDDLSSFLEPSERSTSHLREANTVVRRIKVPVRTLRDEISRLQQEVGCRRIFLKLDTQGHDMAIIRGGGNAMELVVALQVELSLVPIYEGMPDWLSSMAELQRLGYSATGVFPVSWTEETQRLVEMDCVLVRGP